MTDTNEQNTCNVCGLNNGEIIASGMAPVSYICCETCLEQGAEEIWVICLRLHLDEGGPQLAELGPHGDWWKTKRSYHGGKYIGWKEIAQIYDELEPELIQDDLPQLEDVKMD